MGSTASTLKRVLAVLIAAAVVVGAGIVVGGAPTLFGVDDEPTASITFEDQEGSGENVTVESVTLSEGGFVVIGDGSGTVLATSSYLEAGTHENVTVEADGEDADLVGQLTATVHQDTDGDERYAPEETDGEADPPYLEDGYPVSETATVTMAGGEGSLDESFTVESIDAPSTATTNETIDVNATVRNPTNSTAEQHVELRLGGRVIERQLVEIEAGDTREVSFEIDTSDVQPGTHSVGVFTQEDGALDELEIEFDGAATLEPVSGNETAITANATLPESGFVAIERLDDAGNDTDRERLGTSDALDAGDHEVVVELDEPVEADDELVAVLYAGDPETPDEATVLETDDGDPVEVTFTLDDLEE